MTPILQRGKLSHGGTESPVSHFLGSWHCVKDFQELYLWILEFPCVGDPQNHAQSQWCARQTHKDSERLIYSCYYLLQIKIKITERQVQVGHHMQRPREGYVQNHLFKCPSPGAEHSIMGQRQGWVTWELRAWAACSWRSQFRKKSILVISSFPNHYFLC